MILSCREGRGFDKEDYKKQKSGTLRFGFRADIVSGRVSSRKTIEIKGVVGIVDENVGIVTKSKTFEPVINSVEDYYTCMQESSGAVYVPK